MSYWLNDPELFLYVKGTGPDDVHLWRCKKPASSSSSLVVPMKPDDFHFVKIVKNHLELIGYMDVWDESDYNRLVKYIYEKRFLVNIQGFVIGELLHKANKDGNTTIDDANEEVPAIYIRSLDVLPLKPYIPNLMERPIPLRTVRYLGDVNGKAAPMEDDNDDDSNLAKRVADLELKNKTMEGKVTKSNADLATRTSELANSQNQVADLELKNKTLQGEVTKTNADLATRTSELANSQYQLNRVRKTYMEIWMNDNDMNDRLHGGIETLRNNYPEFDSVTVVGGQGSYTGEGLNTNVHARYWYKVSGQYGTNNYIFEAVCIDDLNPNRERARFSYPWKVCTIQGKKYVIR